jgi:hypothetical protein
MRRTMLLMGLMFLLGCGEKKLETGYAYTPLGDSPTKRRSYYADPFSPESRAAQQERQSDLQDRRPVPGQ